VPTATPLPRGPSILTLYSAADLLTAPGCPVCRYAAEAADRYLGWFALEGHAQPDTITRLCACLGTCGRHTRRLMSQPGAGLRLTAVYRYVVAAARDRLAGRADRVATCPACDHDQEAAGRALDTLIEGIADAPTLYRLQDLGGLCLPHVAGAATIGRRRPGALLTQTMRAAAAGTDPDAETRAVLRRAMPATGVRTPGSCPPCLAGAQAERDALDRLAGLASDGPDPALTLCADHLADAVSTAGDDGLRVLLSWQAECLTARLAARPARRLPVGRRRRDPAAECAVCRTRHAADRRALADLTDGGRFAVGPSLCVRHHLVLRVADPRTSRALAPAAVEAADALSRELTADFDHAVLARSRGAAAPDSGVWRRAAAFLDGAVFGGYPARLR
jgi:hypothetical protein